MVRSLLLVAALFAATPAFAQDPQSAPPAATTVADASREPVPVPEPSEKAIAYYRSGVALWLFDVAWGLLVPGVILFTGFSARMRTWAARIGRKWFLVIAAYFVLFSLVGFAVDLPRIYYEDFVRQHAYGLSNQTFAKWMTDNLIGLAVSLVIGVLFLWIPFLVLRKSPERWWLYTGLLAIPFLCLMLLVTPVWLDPLFNDFGPMKDKALEQKILALADRAGIEGSRVYEVNKSVDTKAINAYVSGLGDTKRIVLWDTIIARLDEPELLFVMGHEMGHYVLGHTWKLVGLLSILIMTALYAIHRTAGWVIARWRDRIGFDSLADVASLPLLLLLFSAYFFVVTPVGLAFSRSFEHESDRFGLEITRTNRPAAMAFVKMQQDNLGNPRPHWLVRLWRASHPTLAERIDFCNAYRPWEHGQPLAYEHLIK
jgi:Zn-dependent protease with chaperone function